MAGRKSKATIKSEQHLTSIISSWQQKNYGNTVKEDDYVKYYTMNFDSDVHVGYLRGESKVTKNMGDFNSVTFASSVSIPFAYDPTNPESEENKGRFNHATLLRDHLLESDLEKLDELAMDNFKRSKN